MKEDLRNIVALRAKTSYDGSKYQAYCELYIDSINAFGLETSSDISLLPQGILAEYFFIKAFDDKKIHCFFSEGIEDMRGIDCIIKNGKEEYGLNLTINNTFLNIKKKLGREIPFLYIPWCVNTGNIESRYCTYAQRYLKSGEFDSIDFLRRVYDANSNFISQISRGKVREVRAFKERYIDLPNPNGDFIRKSNGILGLIKRVI